MSQLETSGSFRVVQREALAARRQAPTLLWHFIRGVEGVPKVLYNNRVISAIFTKGDLFGPT